MPTPTGGVSSGCDTERINICATQGATLVEFISFGSDYGITTSCTAELVLKLGPDGREFGRFTTALGNFEIQEVTIDEVATPVVRLYISGAALANIPAQKYWYSLRIACDGFARHLEGYFDLAQSGLKPNVIPACDTYDLLDDCCNQPCIYSLNDELETCRDKKYPLIFEVDFQTEAASLELIAPYGRWDYYAWVKGQWVLDNGLVHNAERYKIKYMPFYGQALNKAWLWDENYRGGSIECCDCPCHTDESLSICIVATNECKARCRRNFDISIDSCCGCCNTVSKNTCNTCN